MTEAEAEREARMLQQNATILCSVWLLALDWPSPEALDDFSELPIVPTYPDEIEIRGIAKLRFYRGK